MNEHEHSPEAIEARLAAGPRQIYLRDWVYGGIDGAVTTFAIVSGIAGAQLSASIVLALGFANLIADGFSMAASNYLATRTEHDELAQLESLERPHIATVPEGNARKCGKSFSEKDGWWRSGLSTLVVGMLAAGLAYGVGRLLRKVRLPCEMGSLPF